MCTRATIIVKEEYVLNLVNDIREKQNELIIMINTVFDEIVNEVNNLKDREYEAEVSYESVYPLTNKTGFKGKKPIAVEFDGHREITSTWKIVVKTILKKVIEDKKMKNRIMLLRNKVLGRVRIRISDKDIGMNSPLELCEDLYIETHYDTEALINLLLQILNDINYDYSNIKIVIKS